MRILGLIGAILVALTTTAGVRAESIELKLGHVGKPGSLFAVSADEFAKRANVKLAGKAKVVVYGGSTLGKDKEMLQKLKLGSADLALPSSIMSTVVTEFGLFEMPYLIKDREHMRRIERDIFWTVLAPKLLNKGYRAIAVWENGFRHITNSQHPINVPDDLRSLKLRTPKSAWRLKMFRAYGAEPTPMPFSAVYGALETGNMQGQENPYAQIYSAKLHEVQKYLTITGHVYTPAYLIAGERKWQTLPDDVRVILMDVAKGMQSFVYEQAARMEVELLDKIRAAGVEVNEADKDAFIRASEAIYDEFSLSVPEGAELVQRARKLAPAG